MSDETLAWTYVPGKQEELYLKAAFAEFFEDQWLIDVISKVRVGKEATCFRCRAHPDTGYDLVAAKVYRPRAHRAMKNDWFYRLGRTMATPDHSVAYRGRVLRALKKHTRFGKKVENLSWTSHELDLLTKFHEAGADVPQPYIGSENTLLMEFIGDEFEAAPTLHMVSLELDEAKDLFNRVVRNIETMLRSYLIHADLSAHNIFYWNGEIKIIDLPQAVIADNHPGALDLLLRDVTRVCEYFAKQGVQCNAGALTSDLWQRMQKGEL